MNKKYEIVFYSILVIIGLVIVGLIIRHDYFLESEINNDYNNPYSEVTSEESNLENDKTLNNEQGENLENNSNNSIETNNKTDDNLSVDKQDENNSNNNTSTNNNNDSNSNNTVNNNNNNNSNNNSSNSSNVIDSSNNDSNKEQEENISYSNKDLIVINELNTLEKNTTNVLAENNTGVLDKAKGVFISLVDFCFFDGEIKGITFDELTTKGKEKVLQIVNKIDEKIENKFPGYKEKITTKTTSAFNKASSLIKKGANNINEFAKDKLGDENYQAMIEEKDELVLYTKNAWNLVKNFSSNIWQKTKDKLTKWYENFKNN